MFLTDTLSLLQIDGDIRSSSSDEITLDDDSNTKLDDANGTLLLPNGTT